MADLLLCHCDLLTGDGQLIEALVGGVIDGIGHSGERGVYDDFADGFCSEWPGALVAAFKRDMDMPDVGAEALCHAQNIPVLCHTLPYRSDTVRLGLAALRDQKPALRGCLFLPGDQPLLTKASVETLLLAAVPDGIVRLCSADGTPGSPVLFGAAYFAELLHLPDGRGGSAVVRAHPEAVRLIPSQNAVELCDVDTREDLAWIDKQQ